MMNKHKYISIVLGLIGLAGCSENESVTLEQAPRSFTIQVRMPQTSQTRVSVSQKADSRDLIPVWEKGDVMKFYTYDTKGEHGSIRIFHVGTSAVENISDDGTIGSFSISYPTDASFDPWQPFSLVGICGKDSKVDGREIQVEASAYRANISDFHAPVWFVEKEVGIQPVVSSCKHFGVYEVLHVTNTSDKPVSVKFKGYETDELWYRNEATFLPITHYYVDEKLVSSTGQSEAPVQTLAPSATADFVSWYTPSNVKLKAVTLVAEIDGNEVRTSNKKSSDVTMQVGHAYHMYVTWNGKDLKFGNSDDVNYGEFALDNNSCSLKIDEEKTVQITGGSGSFDVSCDNTNVATALLNDMKITVRGVAGGMATITVRDKMTGIEKQINVFVSGNNGDKYICHNKTIDGVTYCIYKQYDRNSKITNADKTPFYKSELVMEITKDGVTTVHTIGKDLYLADNYWNGMVPCVMLDQSSRMMYIFMASKNGSGGYDENGYMYLSSIDAIDFKRETVFSAKNWGWFPYFKGYENEKIAISHFSYNGYEEMKALRSSDGKWSNSTVRDISPANASKNWYNATLFLVLPAEGGMPIPDDKPVDDVPPDGDVID